MLKKTLQRELWNLVIKERNFAEERAKRKRIEKLKFEELIEEFTKRVRKFILLFPMSLKATKAELKRFGEELQTKTTKRQKIDDKDAQSIENGKKSLKKDGEKEESDSNGNGYTLLRMKMKKDKLNCDEEIWYRGPTVDYERGVFGNLKIMFDALLVYDLVGAYQEAHNEDIQRNLKITSEVQVRGGLLGIIVNRLKSGSYRVKSGRHS
ncbi:hypothetical protein Tco_0004850 [Tanacetum coccineum]